MIRFNLFNPILVVIIACFLLAVIFGAVVLWPKFQEIERIEGDIAWKERELQRQEVYFSGLRETKDELRRYQEQLTKIDSALPDDPSLPSLFNFLQKISSESGLILVEIGPAIVSFLEEKPEIKETKFSLELAGSYPSFKVFLARLEKSARIIEIEEVVFSSPEDGELFTFNLRIKVHSY